MKRVDDLKLPPQYKKEEGIADRLAGLHENN
jgi:hypothetical protein